MRITAPAWERFQESRVKIAFAVALVGLLAFGCFTLLGFRDTAESNSWVDHTYRVLEAIEGCKASLNEAESDQRGYLITREDSYLDGYRVAITQVQKDEQEVSSMTLDNTYEVGNIAKLKPLIEKKIALLDSVTRLRRNPNVKLRQLHDQLVSGVDVKKKIETIVVSMEEEERQLLRNRLSSTHAHGIIALVFFGATTISAILLLTGIYTLILRLLRSFAESQQQQILYSESLEQEVARTQAARKELERSNRELQDFAFVASHDLQEPLRKIRSYGERLKSRLGADLGEASISDLNRMQNAAERMQGLINDILSLSRVTSKTQPFTSVNLNKVFDEVVEDLEARIKQTGAEVTRDDLPVLSADPVQMRQLLQNLIGNALKFIKPGVIPQVKVTSLATPPAGMTGFVVSDNGIGFDEKHAEKIFTVFQRLHSRTEYEGTGVGLSICRRIVERHGGYVIANGAVGEGASFTVGLPRSRQRKAAQEEK